MDEIIVDIELIDEIVVDALQDDEVSVTIEDADEVDVKAFDYPPDIARLNQEVIAAKEDAANAVDLATQANQTASQAAQAAQEAETIAEGAATSAGEAVQAINEHAQAVDNPHASNTTQTFAEANIAGLKSDASAGGEVPATLYNWFKSVYSSLVDSSVKSWIIGIVTQLKWLTDNIGGGGYLLKYTVPADTSAISLTVDKNGQPLNFVEGDKIEIILRLVSNLTTDPRLRLNNITTDVYRYGAFGFTSFGLGTIGRNTFGGIIELTVFGAEVYGFCSIINETGTTRNTNTQALKTIGLNASIISSIQIFHGANLILAGSEILIRKK